MPLCHDRKVMEPRNVEVHDTQDERLRRRSDGCLGAHSCPVGDGGECFSGAAILVSGWRPTGPGASLDLFGSQTASVSQENMLDVRDGRPHSCAKETIIGIPEPSAHFPPHVHLDQRELLEILRVDSVEIGD
jgi:hypothetical protein